MKTIPIALANHIATGSTTLAHAFKITRADGAVYAYTDYHEDQVIDGVSYEASPGFMKSAFLTSANLAVGNLELVTPHDGSIFTTADIMGKAWDNATFVLFRYNWENPADGIESGVAGNLGEITIRLADVVVELRDIRQYMQQSVGLASSKTCRARLGSTGYGGCHLDLAPFTKTGTITSVTSNRVFRDNTRADAADAFGEGEITFTSGNNTGYSAKVKDYAADGTFTLAIPMFSTLQVGDAYTAVYGCRKRWDTDCRDKFDNLLNFQGEPHRVGQNQTLALT